MAASPLDQPALGYPPDQAATAPTVDGHARECMVMFRDGTWRLCRVTAWQRDGDSWRVLLRWGVSGQLYEEWFLHAPERIRPGSNPQMVE